MKLNEFIKITEAAKFLGVCPATLRNWQKKGKLRSFVNPVNDYRLYKMKDLEKFKLNLFEKEEKQ